MSAIQQKQRAIILAAQQQGPPRIVTPHGGHIMEGQLGGAADLPGKLGQDDLSAFELLRPGQDFGDRKRHIEYPT